MSRLATAVFALVTLVFGTAFGGDRYLSYTNEHVVVREDNPQGLYPPTPLVNPQAALTAKAAAAVASTGNVSVQTADPAFVTTDACGKDIGRRLVLCLDERFVLTPQDQLAFLSWLATPAVVYVRTPLVAAYLRTVLIQIPNRIDNAQIADETVPSCAFQCERVIVVEK